MNKKRISIMLSGLLMMTMVSCSNKETTSGSSANSDARTVEDSALQGTWAADYSRDEVQSLHEYFCIHLQKFFYQIHPIELFHF